jgi:hypothetical protein
LALSDSRASAKLLHRQDCPCYYQTQQPAVAWAILPVCSGGYDGSEMSYCDGGVAGAAGCWPGGGMSTRASQCSIVPWPTQLSVISPAFTVAFELGGAIVPLKPLAEIRQAGAGFECGTSEVARTQVISAGPLIVNLSGCAPELVST